MLLAMFVLLCYVTVRDHLHQHDPSVPKPKDIKPSLTPYNSLQPFSTMTEISQNNCLQEKRT